MEKIELPALVNTLQDYKQCVDKISDWFARNTIRLSDDNIDNIYKKLEFIDAEFYFFTVINELITHTEYPTDEYQYTMAKLIFSRMKNTLQRRLDALEKASFHKK